MKMTVCGWLAAAVVVMGVLSAVRAEGTTAPATLPAKTLVYSVTVPVDLEYQIENKMYQKANPHRDDKYLKPAGAYLAYHRAGFIACVSVYLRDGLVEYKPQMEQMMSFEMLGQQAGYGLAYGQLKELEKALGREGLVKMLMAQGYEAAGKEGP